MDIQKDWRDTRFKNTSQFTIEEILNGRRISALERLSQKYRRFSIVALLLIIISFTGKFTIEKSSLDIWISIIMACYCATCSVMDYWLYRGITRIDFATMSVHEVITKSLFYRKRHLQFMAVLIPWAIVIVSLIFYANFSEIYMLMGLTAGLIIGLAIGLRNLFDFLDDYKTLTQ